MKIRFHASSLPKWQFNKREHFDFNSVANMITRTAFCLLLIVTFVVGENRCLFDFSTRSSNIFLQKFGDKHLLLTGNTNFLMDDGNYLYAVCYSGYSGYSGYSDYSEYPDYDDNRNNLRRKELKITCENGGITYRTEEGYNFRASLECDNNDGKFYRKLVEYCEHDGLVYGFLIKNVSVVLAEVCFDSYRMKTTFIHYVSGYQPPILEKQNMILPDIDLANITKEVFIPRAISLEDLNSKLNPGKFEEFRKFLNFTLDSLARKNLITNHYSNFIKNFENVNSVPWWTSLKYGNWKVLENVITRRGLTNKLNVYSGTSGILEDFSYKDGTYERNIPFYMWTLIRQDNETDVVVIGINSPFVATTDKNLIFCKDICDQIDWLSPIWSTRKMPTLGYIFCCGQADVVNILDGFPNMAKNHSSKAIISF